jgi:hypothetical protein
LERLVRSWRRVGREDEAALEARRHELRCFSVFPDDNGMYQVRGALDPEVGALLMRTIEAAGDALYRGSVPETTPEQRRADALALIVERARAMGFVSEPDASAESSRVGCASDADDGDPVGDGASAETRHAIARRSERYMVVLHVDEATLDPEAEAGRSELEDGTRVSAESSRRIACDASLVRVVESADGEVVRVEAKRRTVPLRMRRELEMRDRGCRFPGCGSRFTDAHHIKHWTDGGVTRLDNLILLCKTHHRLLHEGGFRLEPDARRPGKPIFFSPRGVRIPEVPPRMTIGGRPIGERGARGPTDELRWEEDVPLAVYLRALESLLHPCN